MLIGLLEPNGGRFLQRTHAAVTDSGVGSADIFDQVLWSDQPTYSPSSCVKVFAAGSDSEREIRNLWTQCGYSRKWDVIKTIVHLIAEYENIVFDAEVCNSLELISAEYLTNGVMRTVQDKHPRLWSDGSLKSFEVKCPFAGRSLSVCAFLWRL